MARVWTGLQSRVSYLRRLSIVFAVELRLKIVTELYMRKMSPKQFHAEFGGGSLMRVTQNFERLEEEGWLRFLHDDGPGGTRRGGIEHFYRATELAVFDNETWSVLPYSIRLAFSWTSFKQLAERVRRALEAGTLEARSDHHFTCMSLTLDQRGSERVLGAIDNVFAEFFDEQEDAAIRVYDPEEELFRATAGLVAFESPKQDDGMAGSLLVENDKEPPVPFPQRLSKVFDDEVSLRIIAETNLRALSPTQSYAEFGHEFRNLNVNGVHRRFRRLVKIGWLKQVGTKTGGRRRGATEKFYRATGPAIFRSGPWTDLPDSVSGTRSWATFEQLSDLAKEAMKAGTFDGRLDRHLTWSALRLDQRGWEKMTDALDVLLWFLLEEQERAKTRMKRSGEKPLTMTVGLSVFESPKTEAKEP